MGLPEKWVVLSTMLSAMGFSACWPPIRGNAQGPPTGS